MRIWLIQKSVIIKLHFFYYKKNSQKFDFYRYDMIVSTNENLSRKNILKLRKKICDYLHDQVKKV